MSKFSRGWKVRAAFLIVLLALSAAACGWWYVFHYTKSPDYSVRMLHKAIEKHDTELFQKYADVDSLLDSSVDVLMDSLIDSEKGISPDTKLAISNFTRLFKGPLVESFRDLVLYYVNNGDWGEPTAKDKLRIDGKTILVQTGLKDLQFRQVEYVNLDDSGSAADVGIRLFVEEVGEEYVLNVLFDKDDSGIWRAKEITDLYGLVGFIREQRRIMLQEYLAESNEWAMRHDTTIKMAELQQAEIIAAGNLSKSETRQRLKKLYQEVVIPDWKLRQEELDKFTVPVSARHLHRLRQKICELRLQQAEFYIKWLDDKQGNTVRRANDCLREAATLERELLMFTQRLGKKDK